MTPLRVSLVSEPVCDVHGQDLKAQPGDECIEVVKIRSSKTETMVLSWKSMGLFSRGTKVRRRDCRIKTMDIVQFKNSHFYHSES